MRIALWTSLAISLCFCGCWDRSVEITLNPDGSGKAVIVVEGPAGPIFRGKTAASMSEEEKSQEALDYFVNQVQGVDVWADLSCSLNQAMPKVSGTAYFPDVTKFRSPGLSFNEMNKTADGGMVIKLRIDMLQALPNEKPLASQPSTQEVRDAIKQARAEVSRASTQPDSRAIIDEIKIAWIIHLPGEVKEAPGFLKVDAKTISLTATGKKYMSAVEEIVADDAAMEDYIRHPENRQKVMMKKLFGVSDPDITIRVGLSKPQFDYAAEVKKAKAASQPATVPGRG